MAGQVVTQNRPEVLRGALAHLRVGGSVVVRYEGGESWRERLLLWPVTTKTWIVLTPDQHVCLLRLGLEDPAIDPIQFIALHDDGARPDVSEDIHAFTSYPSLEELRELVATARDEAWNACPPGEDVPVYEVVLPDGRRAALAELQVLAVPREPLRLDSMVVISPVQALAADIP